MAAQHKELSSGFLIDCAAGVMSLPNYASPHYFRSTHSDGVLPFTEHQRQKDVLQQEFVSIVQQAKLLYTKTKKKKGNAGSQ